MIIFLIGVWFALAPTWFNETSEYYDLLPWTSEKTERSGVINNSEIKFLKHTVWLPKTCIITAAVIKNQNHETLNCFLYDFITLFST